MRKVAEDHLPYFCITIVSHYAIASTVAPPAQRECGESLLTRKPHACKLIVLAVVLIIDETLALVTYSIPAFVWKEQSKASSSLVKLYISATISAKFHTRHEEV